tara:strand:- start:362 stop:1024 length:663 start_codon:yes stop_codon:yes gene_type:complete
MKNKIIIIFFIILTSCFSEKKNLIIEGQINGIKNSKIYLLSAEEGKIIDSVNIIDGKFTLKTYIDVTKEMSMILGDKNSENKFDFISEPAHILFTSSKDKFVFNGKIQNSKLYSDYINLKNQINRFNEKDLKMLAEQIKISVEGNPNKYDSINEQRLKINQRKILFIVNYAMNNGSNPISAFISYKFRENINKKYLEKIYENLSGEIKNSYYGVKLNSSF